MNAQLVATSDDAKNVVDLDGFQKALKPIRVKVSQVEPTKTTNNFSVVGDW